MEKWGSERYVNVCHQQTGGGSRYQTVGPWPPSSPQLCNTSRSHALFPSSLQALGGASLAHVGYCLSIQALEFIASDAYWDEVEEVIEECQVQGVISAPHTVANGRWAIIGGQMSDTYYEVRTI